MSVERGPFDHRRSRPRTPFAGRVTDPVSLQIVPRARRELERRVVGTGCSAWQLVLELVARGRRRRELAHALELEVTAQRLVELDRLAELLWRGPLGELAHGELFPHLEQV